MVAGQSAGEIHVLPAPMHEKEEDLTNSIGVLNIHDDWDFYRFFFQLSVSSLQEMGLLGHAGMAGQ